MLGECSLDLFDRRVHKTGRTNHYGRHCLVAVGDRTDFGGSFRAIPDVVLVDRDLRRFELLVQTLTKRATRAPVVLDCGDLFARSRILVLVSHGFTLRSSDVPSRGYQVW